MKTLSVEQIIESMLEADNLPRVPKKIKMSFSTYQLLSSIYERPLIVGDTTWEGIPAEIDWDLFGYTCEVIYDD